MKKNMQQSDGLFFIVCLTLGILAEESFFRGQIGISNIVFIVALYGVFFWRFYGFPFANQRLGYLVAICIWLLSINFYISNNMFFYVLNIVVVPVLVLFHFLLIARPKLLLWTSLSFVKYAFWRIIEAIRFDFRFSASHLKFFKGDNQKIIFWKKVLIGIILSLPVLGIVLYLLSTADANFKQIVGNLPEWFHQVKPDTVFRFFVIIGYTFAFFGVLFVLGQKKMTVIEKNNSFSIPVDGVIALTVLVLMNAVYLLFTIVQFQYFFGGILQESYTFAQYARKGFFELLAVSIINLSLTVSILLGVKQSDALVKKWLQISLSLLILMSCVILVSAFLRMYLYEKAYGFTFTRMLAHSFMIFLTVIFAYTLVKIWFEKLSLFHFYFISALLYYTGINVVDLDRLVVQQNLVRYEQTGNIDLQYLNHLSYTGVLGLIQLYEKNPDLPGLREILRERKREIEWENRTWQSANLKQQEASAALKKLPN